MYGGWNWSSFLMLALLGAGVLDDLRSRKVHNSLIAAILIISLWSVQVGSGVTALPQALVSVLAAFGFCLPLYLLRAVGGGDVKLVIAVSPLLAWAEIGWMMAFSLVWALLLGLVMMALHKELNNFFKNLFLMSKRVSVGTENLHKIPYTVALLLGFMTQFTLAQKGISLL